MNMSVDAQKDISFYEALAQLCLFVCRIPPRQPGSPAPALHGNLMMRQLCDNMSAVGAINKLFSTASPMCWVMQAFAHYASRANAEVHVCHVAGARNEWADMLSRAAEYSDFVNMLPPENKVEVDVLQLLESVWPLRQ